MSTPEHVAVYRHARRESKRSSQNERIDEPALLAGQAGRQLMATKRVLQLNSVPQGTPRFLY